MTRPISGLHLVVVGTAALAGLLAARYAYHYILVLAQVVRSGLI